MTNFGPARWVLAWTLVSSLMQLGVGERGTLYAQSAAGAARNGGRALYEAACAACHGSDGTGLPQVQVGFETPLPDFTDCSFASREPDADWFAVVHDGGPVRAFDRMMPAFGDALSDEEIQAILSYVRSFCTNTSWPRGELNLPRPMFTEKAYLEDEAVWTTSVAAEGRGSVSNEFVYEKRFGARNQIEIVVPFELQKPAGRAWRGGIGDVAVGLKRAVFHSLAGGTILSLAGEVILPTGDRDEGFGAAVTRFEPFVAMGQVLPGDGFLQAQAGVEFPTSTERIARRAFWRGAIGRSFTQGRFGRTWSPMIEVLASRDLVSGATVQWDVVPQFQVTLNTRQHVMANVATQFPLTDTAVRPMRVLVYLLLDWFDGGLLDGW